MTTISLTWQRKYWKHSCGILSLHVLRFASEAGSQSWWKYSGDNAIIACFGRILFGLIAITCRRDACSPSVLSSGIWTIVGIAILVSISFAFNHMTEILLRTLFSISRRMSSISLLLSLRNDYVMRWTARLNSDLFQKILSVSREFHKNIIRVNSWIFKNSPWLWF